MKFTSAPENQINNGTELTFPNSEPLNGVEFNVYDITATYYPSKDTAVPADATPFASVTTSGEGLANLTLPGKSDGKDAVYVFVETPKPGVETSPNIVLSLPFYNPNSSDPDKPLDTIHLYAKNVIKESNIKIQKAGNFSGVDKLAGAQFQIKNSENQFVTGFDENTGVALYDPAESALTFTTDTEGSISVNGLIDGNYTLVETKAPDGYQLTNPQKETTFIVKNGKLQQTTGIIHGADEVTGSDWEEVKLISDSEGKFSIEGLKQGAYCLQETKAPEGYALPKNEAAYTEFTVDDDPTTSDETTIDNQPKGILPSTGGMGIIVFILVGTALVGGAVIYFKKRHQETEA
ncbi:SpaA isopeptide-forming pilin-related protein [Enterococcus faecium]|uniref:SpaA isopeptide-forming pilin-related protein n=1 Tax=Enterococcus faecium TaxID=1352 RepID=UPI00295EC5B7|nr:SpaA isopeptide-forming pilin-related protein [Enterococcus faecium]